MKLNEIKRDGFYTDETKIICKVKDEFVQYFQTKEGISSAYCYDKDLEVRKVMPDETFYNGDIKVIDQKNIEIKAIVRSYEWLQFADLNEAEEYAKANNLTVFDWRKYNEYVSVELMKVENQFELINFKNIK